MSIGVDTYGRSRCQPGSSQHSERAGVGILHCCLCLGMKTLSQSCGALYLDHTLMKKQGHSHQLIQETSHVGSGCSGCL